MSTQSVIAQSPSADAQGRFQIKTIEEAAEFLRTPVSTLRYWRHMKKGPRAARIGGRIMYRQADLENWLNDQFEKEA